MPDQGARWTAAVPDREGVRLLAGGDWLGGISGLSNTCRVGSEHRMARIGWRDREAGPSSACRTVHGAADDTAHPSDSAQAGERDGLESGAVCQVAATGSGR